MVVDLKTRRERPAEPTRGPARERGSWPFFVVELEELALLLAAVAFIGLCVGIVLAHPEWPW